jgi:NADPH:quinone reductase-like Zn-dependent oxidoreductase
MRLWLGPLKPRGTRIPGTEFAGVIEAAGSKVKRFKVGDPVFGSTGLSFGANAEYVVRPEEAEEGVLARKPANMTYEEAACIPFGGLDALHFLRKGAIKSGHKILINGAGGSIGTFAVQLARIYEARVTAVDSASKLDMLLDIGADRVIDYTREDFTKSGQTYDIIFDVVGKGAYSGCLKSLKPNGVLLIANPRLSHMLRAPVTSLVGTKKVVITPAAQKSEDLVYLRELIEVGKLKSVIDRRYPLAQIVEAHRYVETGQKAGNLVITVATDGDA